MNRLSTEIICPYCGFKNKFYTEYTWGREVLDCDFEDGGCDGIFVVEYNAKLSIKTKRVEGENRNIHDNPELLEVQ